MDETETAKTAKTHHTTESIIETAGGPRKLIVSDRIPAMEQILEAALDEAAKGQPEGETAAITCQVVFQDSTQHGGVVKRGPIPRTYVLGQPMMAQNDRRQAVPVEGKMVEMVFHGSDILRIVTFRDVPVTLVGGSNGKLWTPGS